MENYHIALLICFSLLISDVALTESLPGNGCDYSIESFNGRRFVAERNASKNVLVVREITTLEIKTCKMLCDSGAWVGPVCHPPRAFGNADEFDKTCILQRFSKNLSVSLLQQNLKGSISMLLPNGSTLKVRCNPPEKLKRIGTNRLFCTDGEWNLPLPTCQGSNFFLGVKGDSSPPSFSWTIAGGAGALDDQGVIILLPKSILHLDCLFPRIEGNPSWSWSSNFRIYPTGWAISRKEREEHYRLSIYYADLRDSGSFTCTSPKKQNNTIEVIVKDVICDPLELSVGRVLMHNGTSNFLEGTRDFSCPVGYNLIGPRQIKCLPSGEWSDVPPRCQIIRCQKPRVKNLHLKILSLDVLFAGKATFECPNGFILEGNEIITCQLNGLWSHDIPTCQEIICPVLEVPNNGQVQIIGNRRVGSAAIYSCHSGFSLVGSIVSFCLAQGNWSHHPPKCKISCSHPGMPENGRLMPRLNQYHIGYTVFVSCHPGFRPAGPDRLKCLETRKWSSPLTHCVPSLGWRQI